MGINIKLSIKRIAVLLLAVIIICGSFAGCEMAEPSLVLTGDAPYQIPELVGIYNERETNAEIEQYYTQIIDDLKSGNGAAQELSMAYTIGKTDGGYLLSSWLEVQGGKRIALGDIVIQRRRVTIPEYTGGEYLSDPAVLRSMMTALEIGYDVDLPSMSDMVTAETARAMLVRYMEWSCGREIDASSVKNSDITDPNVRKLYAANPYFTQLYYKTFEGDLSVTEKDISTDAKVESTALVRWISDILPWVAFESYGMSSKGFTTEQYFDLLELYVSLYNPISTPEKFGDVLALTDAMIESAERWNSFSSSADLRSAVKKSVLSSSKEITRQELANTSIDIVDKFLYKTTNDDRFTGIDDTTNHKAQKAVNLGLVREFPSGGMFSPSYKPRYYELSGYCYTMSRRIFEHIRSGGDEDTKYADYISFADMIAAIDKVEGYFSSFTKADGEQYKSVKNTRDYDWYLSQFDTGEYAAVNCMPTMTAMAILWHTQNADVTPQKLRDMITDDSFKTTGWYIWQVMSSLEKYKIKHEYRDATFENMMKDLDSGNILLITMSEAKPNDSGHCQIIYGYEKVGDSIVFLVNDPGSSSTRADGCGNLEAIRLDGRYVLFTMERQSTYYNGSLSEYLSEYVAVYPKGA
ncbi:MAG: C39 family peptidase [Oscillospiraceae bacterium]|jgi:hypothetical protein|nr:C39 family peptidase [Oscillospiraceae bacterium]